MSPTSLIASRRRSAGRGVREHPAGGNDRRRLGASEAGNESRDRGRRAAQQAEIVAPTLQRRYEPRSSWAYPKVVRLRIGRMESQTELQTDLDATGLFEARYVAFLETITHLRPRLHRYCSRMTGSVLDGEDVMQEAVFEAYRKLDTF